MARDNRRIHSAVRHEGKRYKDGMEDELAAAMSGKQLDRLAAKGAISGNWASAAPEPVKEEDKGDAGGQKDGGEKAVDLSSMTVTELKAHAKKNNIEVTATKKADLIAEIEAAK